MDVTVETAAEILVSFQNRRLVRWPEWVPRLDEGEPSDEKKRVLEWKVRQKRSSRKRALPAVWSRKLLDWLGLKSHDAEDAALLPLPARKKVMVKVKIKTELAAARRPDTPLENVAGAGSGVNFSREGVARLLPREVVKTEPTAARMPEFPPYYVSAAGSVPSTAGGDRAHPRPRPHPSEKAHAKTVLTAGKEAMEASSPDTPLDYAAATGSGSSPSGDDAAQSPRKRKAPLSAGGSGGASSSGDEGCISPEKRPHLVAVGGAQTAAAKAEGVKFADAMNRNDEGVLMFDLNECLDNCEDWS